MSSGLYEYQMFASITTASLHICMKVIIYRKYKFWGIFVSLSVFCNCTSCDSLIDTDSIIHHQFTDWRFSIVRFHTDVRTLESTLSSGISRSISFKNFKKTKKHIPFLKAKIAVLTLLVLKVYECQQSHIIRLLARSFALSVKNWNKHSIFLLPLHTVKAI